MIIKSIKILSDAETDLEDGKNFYEQQRGDGETGRSLELGGGLHSVKSLTV